MGSAQGFAFSVGLHSKNTEGRNVRERSADFLKGWRVWEDLETKILLMNWEDRVKL